MTEVVSLGEQNGRQSFDIEVSGPDLSTDVLVLAHGFGVKRDSRGMFDDIRARFNDRFVVTSIDLSNPNDSGTEAIPISQQVDRFDTTIDALHLRYGEDLRLVFVGHSMGCFVVSKSAYITDERLLLAPPTGRAYEEFIKTSGWSRPGSVLDVDGTSVLQRSDGTITNVPKEFWDEFKALGNVDLLYQAAAANSPTLAIYAGADNVFGEQEPVLNVPHKVITAADHDFTGEARAKLLKLSDQELTKIADS